MSIFICFVDRKLLRNVIQTLDVTSALECTEACLGVSGCKSYNYQEDGSPIHVCQLNNQSKASAPSSDYVIQAGFSYYDAEQSVSNIINMNMFMYEQQIYFSVGWFM